VLVVVAAIILFAYEQAMSDVVKDWETELARTSAARLSEGMDQYRRLLSTMAGSEAAHSLDPERRSEVLALAGDRLEAFEGGVAAYGSTGRTVWSTPPFLVQVGAGFPAMDDFERLRRTGEAVYSDVFEDEASGRDGILVAVPMYDGEGRFLGALAGITAVEHPDPGAIYAGVTELRVGESGFAYLVDGTGRVIYHPFGAYAGARLTDTAPVARALGGEAGAVLTEDVSGDRVISGFAPVPGTRWGLVVEESWSSVTGAMRGYSALLLGLMAAAVVVSGVLVVLGSGRILGPLRELTLGARRIAGGDFDHTIPVATGDEVQALAEQFNSMAGSLKESYAGLEQKVAERTAGERRRAEQLRAINDVGRRISSILSLEELLPYVVHSMRETFDYYYVHIVLLEPESDELVVRASSAAPGMLAPEQALRLKTSEGMSGWVFRNGESLLANDVAEEPAYIPMPSRPNTRSALTVPIRVGEECLGVLDVESDEPDAFDEVDVFTVETLADQVAIAMENTRLYRETRDVAVLEERNRMAREIHDTLAQGFTGIVLQLEAAEEARGEAPAAAQEHLDRARELARQSLNEARRSVWALRPDALERQDLTEALRSEVGAFAGDSGVQAGFSVSGEQRDLAPDIEGALLRICQESLANVRKHASATRVEVSLEYGEDSVALRVQDDGAGFRAAGATRGGFGLIGMRERARLLGGGVEISSEPGKGTLVVAMLPGRGR
jgi:nitrate/nitrite-specific signal transduction histidine kinase